MAAVIRLAVLFSSAIHLAQATFFLSTDHVDKVLESEEYVITLLELYYALDAPDDNASLLAYTKSIRSQNRESYEHMDGIVSDVFLQVRVLKRLSVDWQRMEAKLSKMKNYARYAARMTTYLARYPTKKDYQAACQALFHFQELRAVSIRDLQMLHDFDDVSRNDYYDIGLQALRVNDLHYAAMWMEEGVKEDVAEKPNSKLMFKLIEIYNATDLIDNGARILSLCQKLHKMQKSDESTHAVYRATIRKVKAMIKAEQQTCVKSDNLDKCLEYIDKHYYEHDTRVPKQAIYATAAFQQYRSQCLRSSSRGHPSYCQISQPQPFRFVREEIFYSDEAVKVAQYHSVFDQYRLEKLLDLANSKIDNDKKRLESGFKFRISKPSSVKKLVNLMAPVTKLQYAAIEVQMYLSADLKFPSDSDLIAGGRTQIVCFFNVGRDPNDLVLPYLGLQVSLQPGSCVALHYAERTEAHKVQHSICPITIGSHWIMTMTL